MSLPVLFIVSLLLGCGADALLVMDPILAATADVDGRLTRDVSAVARAAGVRIRVERLPSVSGHELSALLQRHRQPVVLLPSLLAAEIESLAGQYPQRRFYLVGRESPPRETDGFIAAVSFDRARAFTSAGEATARWLAAHQEAEAQVLVLLDSPRSAAELEAFRAGLGDPVPSRLRFSEFPARPERDQLLAEVRPTHDGLLTVLFLGAANSTARDQLGNRSAPLITESLPPGTRLPGLVGYVSNGYGDALSAVLASDPEDRDLVVNSRYVVPSDR